MKTLLYVVLIASAFAFYQNQAAELTDADKKTILKMWEEEKMARDVYSLLSEKWNLQVFSNIKEAEKQHMQEVAIIAEKYTMKTALPEDVQGKFKDKEMQSLYDDLSKKGSASLEDALKSGALIEETDIVDLRKQVAATTNTDLRALYKRLEAASENHLRAFNRNLVNKGYIYTPVVLSKADFNKIISAQQKNNKGGKAKCRCCN